MQSNISKFLSDPLSSGADELSKRQSELSVEEIEAVVAAAHGEGNDEEHSFIIIQHATQNAQEAGVSNVNKAAPRRAVATSGVKT